MNLNEHLIQVLQVLLYRIFSTALMKNIIISLSLQELSVKNDQLRKLEDSTEIYRRKISVLKHQQSLLYKQYTNDKKVWTEDKTKLEKKYSEMEITYQTLQIQITEFQV